MEKNKNTLLLTVIAIATLLVAVIGATFAFFTATVGGNEDSSTVMATAVNLYIDYEGGTAVMSTSRSSDSDPVVPNEVKDGKVISASAFATKEFSLTPRYNEGAEIMAYLNLPYMINLVVTKNTFELENALTGYSISYKLFNTGSKGLATTDFVGIPYYNGGEDNPGNTERSKGKLGNITIYDNDGNGTPVAGVQIGQAQFDKNEAAAHTYRLELYFIDDGTDQNADREKEFSAYINISTGNLAATE